MDGDALLDDELRALREGFAARRPKLMADLAAAIKEIEALTIGRALDVGATAPEFRLYDVTHDRGLSFDLPERLRPMYHRGLGFPDRNPATGWRLPVPATFVVDRAGIIRARHCLADYRYRMEPRDILAAIRELPPA